MWVELKGTGDGIICLVDHYDTAIDEKSTGSGERSQYLAAPGADDNGSGMAAVLEAARVLTRLFDRDHRPRRTLRFLHLTAEEFPADSLGARHQVERSLRAGERLEGVIVVDMIGHRADPAPGVFQLSEGESPRSGTLSGLALAAWRELARESRKLPPPEPVVRARFDPESYLYNADSAIFSDAGYPTILINEHLNRFHGIDRDGYHDCNDVPDKLDFGYATAVARVALMTAVMAATR
jgi:Zn-dependent M28 family amino/carboxypeptidase